VDEAGKCRACGACEPAERVAVTHAREAVRQDLDALEKRVKSLRASEEAVEIRVDLDDSCRGLPMELVHAWHARAWMKSLDVVREYRRHDPHGRAAEGEECVASGLETLRPVFLPEGAARVRSALDDPEVLSRVQAEFAPYGKILGTVPVQETTSRWTILSPEALDFSAWLQEKGIKHTLRKDGNAKLYDVAKESLKKKLLRTARLVQESDDAWRLEIEAMEKFSVRELLRAALSHRASNVAVVRRTA
jgi:hypothetical protein